MSIISDIGGIGAVSSLINNVIDKIFPDKIGMEKERAAFLQKAQEMDNELLKGQQAINQIEAGSNSIFVAGWRPFIGWVCGSAFAYHFVLQPFLVFCFTLYGAKIDLPVFNMDALNTVLMGMLGLGALRTTEKVKGTK
jgi:hypothetical protein